jgi:hypothetical protein
MISRSTLTTEKVRLCFGVKRRAKRAQKSNAISSYFYPVDSFVETWPLCWGYFASFKSRECLHPVEELRMISVFDFELFIEFKVWHLICDWQISLVKLFCCKWCLCLFISLGISKLAYLIVLGLLSLVIEIEFK